MYSRYNDGKSVFPERLIRNLKNKIHKHMIAVSKNVINCLRWFYKYNNVHHNAIKREPFDVKFDSYAEYNVDSNAKNAKVKIGDPLRIPKYKNIFVKEYAHNWSEEVFVIMKVKNTVPCSYVINDINGEITVGTVFEKEFQIKNQKELIIEKVIERNSYMSKWKALMIRLIVGLIKTTLHKMNQYFPKLLKLLEERLMSKLIYLTIL